MTTPAPDLPASGSTSWYGHYAWLDEVNRTPPITQRTAPRIAELPQLMTSPPTITFVGTGNPSSTITNARFLSAVDNPYPGTPTALSSNFTYFGGPATRANDYYGVPAQPTLGATLAYRIPGWFYGSTIEFAYRGGGTLPSRLSVNNDYAEVTYTADTAQDGAPHLRKFAFGSAAWRYLEFECAAPFFGIYIGPTDTWIPAEKPGQRLLVIGDSYGGGSGTNALFLGYAQQFGRLLGFSDVYSYSFGGTGLLAVNGSNPKYRDRAADWAAAAPTAVLLQMSINDDGFTTANLITELNLVVPLIQAIPSVRDIWIMGTPARGGGDVATKQTREAALEAAADALGVPYINLVSPYPLWSGTGRVGATTGSGNSDVVMDADAAHPTQVGHDMIAYALAQGVIASLPPV